MKNNSNLKTLKVLLLVLICLVVFIFLFINNAEIFSNNVLDSDSNDGDDFVKIIDVGQGDSILIYSNGYSALIDTGISVKVLYPLFLI